MTKTPQQYRLANTIFFFISGIGYTSWASRIPTIQQQLHLSDAGLGAVLFALPVGLMLTMPLTGKLLNTYQSKQIMLLGAVMYNIMLALPGFVATPLQLAAVLLLFGSSRNLLNLSTNAQGLAVQRLFKQSIMTTFHAIWSLAGFAGAAVGYVMVYFNVMPSWHLLGMSLLLMAITAYAYPNTMGEQIVKQEQKKPFTLPDKHLLKFSIIAFISMACENTMYDWSGIYFKHELHSTKSMATAAFAIFMTAVTIGRFTGDRIVGMFGMKKILRYSSLCIIAGFGISFIFPLLVTACIGYLLIGLGVSCIIPFVYSMAGKSKTLSSGSALASISTVGYLGFLLVPPMVGFISQAASLRFAFMVMAILGGIMLWMVSYIKEEE